MAKDLIKNGSPRPPKGRRHRMLMQEFGQLWTRIEHDLPAAAQRARRIGFCAANPGEGTTSIALNYASILGQRGKRVTLLETNFRSPTFSQQFGIQASPGLWELLEGTADLDECTHSQVVDGVNVITAGGPRGQQALQGADFQLSPIFTQLDTNNDFLVVDTPPLSSSPEANLILPQLDGVVLVVQAGRNRLCAVERTIRGLEHLGAQMLGAVFNKMRYELPPVIDRML